MKRFKPILIGVTVFAVLLIGLNMAGVYKVSSAGGTANEPAIQQGQTFLYSEVLTPKKGDLICFGKYLPWMKGYGIVQFRLCGLPGDQIEMRNGEFFVNGKSFDTTLQLKHGYLMLKADFDKQQDRFKVADDDISQAPPDSLIVNMLDSSVTNSGIAARRIIMSAPLEDSVFTSHPADWTIDNFGPVNVPIDRYFVLADNRNAANDSRFIGFIKKEDYIGKVIWKF